MKINFKPYIEEFLMQERIKEIREDIEDNYEEVDIEPTPEEKVNYDQIQ